MRKTAPILSACLLLSSAFAQADTSASTPFSAMSGLLDRPLPPLSVGVNTGTLGHGLQVGWRINNQWGLRGSINSATVDLERDIDGIKYKGDLSLAGTHLLADWYPFQGVFRLSGGLIHNRSELSATAQLAEDTLIGDFTVNPSQIGELQGKLDFNHGFTPYVGIGWGNNTRRQEGLSFSADVGVVMQDAPQVTLSEVGSNIIPTADLNLEQAQAQQDVDDAFSAYPLLSLGMQYTF